MSTNRRSTRDPSDKQRTPARDHYSPAQAPGWRELTAAILVALGLTFSAPIHADSALSALSVSYFSPSLLKRASLPGGVLVNPPLPADPRFLPVVEEAPELRATLSSLAPTVSAELIIRERFAGRQFTSTSGRLCLFNALQSVSTMKGITYYSATRGRTRTLFKRSYIVSSPNDLAPLSDPRSVRLVESRRIFMIQEDTTFGTNVYQADYTVRSDYFLLTIRNLTTMRYAGLPIVRPGRLLLVFLIFPQGDHITVYGLAGARTPAIAAMQAIAATSFRNRIVAMYRWLASRLHVCPPAGGE